MKIAIIGYYGHENLGDELNLGEMIKLIKKQYQEADITVFSGGLRHVWDKPAYNLVRADNMSKEQYIETLNTFDTVVVGGGGIVFLGANYFDFLMEGLKVPYIFSRVGIDNRIVSDKVCSEISGLFKKAADVTVRTEQDRQLVNKHLKIDCGVVPEAIWNYRAKKEELPSSNRIITVSINAYIQDYHRANIKNALMKVSSPNDVFAISMQSVALDFYYNVESTPLEREIIPDSIGLDRKVGCLASSNLVITSRLHAALLAISHGVPAITIESTPKVRFLMEELGLNEYHCIEEVSSELIEKALNNDSLPASLLEKTEAIRELSNKNILP